MDSEFVSNIKSLESKINLKDSTLPVSIDDLFEKYFYEVQKVQIICKDKTVIEADCLFEPGNKRFIFKNNLDFENLDCVRTTGLYVTTRKCKATYNDEEQAIILGY